MLKKRKIIKAKAEKEQGRRKVRSHAERGRAKKRVIDNDMAEYNFEKKLKKKLKDNKITKEEYAKAMDANDKKTGDL